MTGLAFLAAFVVAIVLMIVMVARLRVHPFLAIMAISLLLALLAGIPLVEVPGVIGSGFSLTFTSIGIVIIFGAFIGAVLEKTGAAFKLADLVIRLVGEKNPTLAMELMGWVVSIPVFCDSGFVVLDPVRKAMVRRTGVSSVAMTLCLSCGLYVSHVFIPPTPGPIAAAQALGIGEDLLLVMGVGVLCSVFPMIAGYLFARYVGPGLTSKEEIGDKDEIVPTYEEIKASFGPLPGTIDALAPLLLPILLMAFGSISTMAKWGGFGGDLLKFLGSPIMALSAGGIMAIIQLFRSGKGKDFFALTDNTLKTVGPILFITAAGGVLGKVIASSDLVGFISSHSSGMEALGVLFPFILASILKTAQGSSTVAITTTAGIVAPLLPALGLVSPFDVSLGIMAIGAGAMTVSHANDSYFWVVTSFGGIKVDDGYRSQTLLTLVIGVASMLEIVLLRMFF
ncbi:MAG: GntP family permease [Bacteroidales bacterium]|nr:GntP family permease [Bacteroidales bacterium]